MTAVIVLPPTSRLPPIKALGTMPVGPLHEAIQYLQVIYNPEICGSRRISRGACRRELPAHNTDTRPSDTTASWDAVRADAFEHAYAIRWLTALIAQGTTHADADAVETLVQSAAALLAICAGAASAGTRTRTYAFGGSVRVQLTDLALRNDDFGSVGAQTWGSACVLAEMIVEEPARFGLGGGPPEAAATAMVRVLELGAGTGLVSLTIGKILDRCGRAEIVASDFHPLALENLRLNIENNNPCPDSCGLPLVSAHFLDWQEAADPANTLEAPFDVQFDEVFGADVIYEVEHAAWISACLKRLVRLTGRFHLVIPIREGFARESEAIERLFPHVEDVHWMEPTLCITQKESIICEAGPDGTAGSRGEVEYAHYTIQWTDGRYGQPAGSHEE
ncbi:putative methyltransferase-domain-containing protein [Lactarius hatsudake]|nr:putative methyltransferase-domain-containing protein [Lactarius hatsudake]